MTTLLYLISAAIATAGASYAAVPLYRVFCQTTNYGGTISQGHDTEKVETMKKSEERLLTIKFNADTAAQMRRDSKYFVNKYFDFKLLDGTFGPSNLLFMFIQGRQLWHSTQQRIPQRSKTEIMIS